MQKVLFVLLFAVLIIGGFIIALASKPATRTPQTATHAPTVTRTPQITPTPTKAAEMACIVTVDALHVRQCAGVGCAVVGSIARSETVTIAEKSGGWVRIGQDSWVNAAFLTCGGVQ
jgi:Bacterial SH3 domain